jgi:hypothetical protein
MAYTLMPKLYIKLQLRKPKDRNYKINMNYSTQIKQK